MQVAFHEYEVSVAVLRGHDKRANVQIKQVVNRFSTCNTQFTKL